MNKKLLIIFTLLLSVLILPMNTNAKEINDMTVNYSNSINENNNISLDNMFILKENCNTFLGNPDDDKSVAWLLQKILNYIKILGPILVVVLSAVEFSKVIINSDDDAMAKAQKKLITRLLLAICLFLIPTLVELMLNIFGLQGTCGIK